MSDRGLTKPVAMFVYNRPRNTERVLNQISAVEPGRLLVVADGPHPESAVDHERCETTRTIIQNGVDWDCDVFWNAADSNMGLKQRFATGLRWIFMEVSEAIILEDDCLPTESFFRFCSTMLDEYRGDKRIMDISGSNHLGEWKADEQDYHFSLYGGIWGWATWRRSWEWYDPEMELWGDEKVRQRVRDVIADDNQADYIEHLYNQTYRGDIETWDSQWGFARHLNSTLSVVPSKNLISNIGFGERATNTESDDHGLANIPRREMTFPVDHPEYVAVDREYDQRFHRMRPISHRYAILRRLQDLYDRLSSQVS